MKYELTNKTIEFRGHTLHQIRYLETDEIGGWAEFQWNLDQDGECMISDNARVFGRARVTCNATVSDNAVVSGNAIISGNSLVFEGAEVFGEAVVANDSAVYGRAQICGNSILSGDANISGDCVVHNVDVAGLCFWYQEQIEKCRDEKKRDLPDFLKDESQTAALPSELVESLTEIGILGEPDDPKHLPINPKARKMIPLASGLMAYFPDALIAVAVLSYIGNHQHNPGSALHWDRSKSGDEWDCLERHFMERGTFDTDGVRHSAKVAWRALAGLQKELEEARK